MSVEAAGSSVSHAVSTARETALLAVRVGLLLLVAVAGAVFAGPRLVAVGHAQVAAVAAPVVAGLLAAARWRGHDAEPLAIPVRAADFTVAAGFSGMAWFLAAELPKAFGADAAAWGASLAVVAPAAAAAIALLLGTRMLYRLRAPVTLLSFMSPALLRPAYAVVDAAIHALTRAALEFAGAPSGIARVLTDRLHAAAAVDASLLGIAVVLPMCAGRRLAKLGWASATLLLAWLAGIAPVAIGYVRGGAPGVLGSRLPGFGWPLALATIGALALLPALGLRQVRRDPQPEPQRCLPRGEGPLLAVLAGGVAALALVAPVHRPASDARSSLGVSAASRPVARPSGAATPDAVLAGMAGATTAAVDPREAALAGPGSHWSRWALRGVATAGLAPSASVSVDTVRSATGLDADVLAAAFQAGGYRLVESRPVRLGSVDAVKRAFAGSAGDGITTLVWTQGAGAPVVVIVTVHEPGAPSSAAALAAQSVAAQIAGRAGAGVEAAGAPDAGLSAT